MVGVSCGGRGGRAGPLSKAGDGEVGSRGRRCQGMAHVLYSAWVALPPFPFFKAWTCCISCEDNRRARRRKAVQ